MSIVERPLEALRIDVAGDLAALELVDCLRWARPSVHPLEGSGWRINIADGIDLERLAVSLERWRETRTDESPAVFVFGSVRLVAA
jgi:hypothetical protein